MNPHPVLSDSNQPHICSFPGSSPGCAACGITACWDSSVFFLAKRIYLRATAEPFIATIYCRRFLFGRIHCSNFETTAFHACWAMPVLKWKRWQVSFDAHMKTLISLHLWNTSVTLCFVYSFLILKHVWQKLCECEDEAGDSHSNF